MIIESVAKQMEHDTKLRIQNMHWVLQLWNTVQ